MPSRISVILNSSAGSAESDAAVQLRKFLPDANFVIPRQGSDLTQVARDEIGRGCDTLVAGGGDGTLNAVAAAVVGTDIAFGILPLGTLNHFARDVGIPTELGEAARIVMERHTRPIDVGEVNGRIFLNNSSLGLYPSIVRQRDRRRKFGWSKWVAAGAATLSAFRTTPFLNVQIQAGGQDLTRRTPFVFIGNNDYRIEGLRLGQRDRLDAGHLAIYVAHRTGRWGLIRLALRALIGHLKPGKDFDIIQSTEIRIETERRHVRVSTDGEIHTAATPLCYAVRAAALRVIAPRPKPAEGS